MTLLRTVSTLLVLLGASLAVAPAPVAANDGDNPPPGGCDSLVDCLLDTVPPQPPGPCGIIQIESCRCLTQVGACGIEVPDPCADVGDCGCVVPEHVNSDDVRVCGFTVNPCAWLQGSNNLCACVNVPTTTTFGRAPTASGSCGIVLPSGPGGDGRPDPCDGLPEDTCDCISISSTIPGVNLAAVPDYVCGVPTNPCALVGTGTLADGCGCVEMNGPQRLSLAGLFAATAVTNTGIVPTSICGIPTDPCVAGGSLGALACECVAQIEREILGGGTGLALGPLAFQRIVTPPALCIEVDPGCLVMGNCTCDGPNTPQSSLPAYNYPPYNATWYRLEDGVSTWRINHFNYERIENRKFCRTIPAPLPYGPDVGRVPNQLGDEAVAHVEPIGDHECHFVFDPIGMDGYKFDVGGFRGRLVSQVWRGVWGDPYGYADLGTSYMRAVHNLAFAEETWEPYYANSAPTDAMEADLCNMNLNLEKRVAWAELKVDWKSGPFVAVNAPAEAEVCYQTTPVYPSGQPPLPLQLCAMSTATVDSSFGVAFAFTFEGAPTDAVAWGQGTFI